jgi:hypothetical protein
MSGVMETRNISLSGRNVLEVKECASVNLYQTAPISKPPLLQIAKVLGGS